MVKEFQDGNFFSVHNAIFENFNHLNCYEKLVYIYLRRCCNQGSDAFPGYGAIAKKCGMSRRSAIRAIKNLNKMGLIQVTPRKYQSNLYTVISDLQALVTEGHYSNSDTETPALVTDSHPPSDSLALYKQPVINNSRINNSRIKGTTVKDNIPITGNGGSASASLRATATPPDNEGNAVKSKLSSRGPKPGGGTTQIAIIKSLREHGASNVKSISQGTGIPEISVRNCLSQNKGLFQRVSRGLYALKDGSHASVGLL